MDITVIIVGGLGNQMFQYALVIALREQGYHVKMDISNYNISQMHNGYELDRVFGINEELVSKKGFHIKWLHLLEKFRPRCIYLRDKLVYTPLVLDNPSKYIYGYWQNEQYFEHVSKKICKIFTFQNIDAINSGIVKQMSSCNSVSLHIRRGDYAEFGMTLIEKDFYRDAVNYILSNVDCPFFYIFSDDLDVANAIVKELNISYKIVNHNVGVDSYKDMYLMSRCRHNIVANSSFSWWGAWLNQHPDKIVIAPKTWSKRRPELKPQPDSWVLM